MKSRASLALLLLAAGAVRTCFADGFIIVPEPGPPPYPIPIPPPIWVPPPRPPRTMPPPPRPYIFAPLEVTYHKVEVKIKDQLAVTSVDQEFYNPNPQQLEGTYVFPVPKGGQIDKFAMDIGGRQVEAELLPADKARRIYEDIVRRHRDPALLEYAGRDVLKARVYPIEPHSRKRITISYTQLLKSDSGLVAYNYPLSTEKFSAAPLKNVSVKIDIESSRPLKSIYSPSQGSEVKRHGDRKATVGYEGSNVRPDHDFQVLFAPEEGEFGLNLMTYRPSGDDGYFLLLASPGSEIEDDKRIVPKDIAFVIDTSGSMAGEKMEQAKKALQFCIANLNAADRFEIVRFSTETEPLFNKLADANDENRRKAVKFVKELKPIGGTAIDDALRKSLKLRADKSDRPFLVIFLTDGKPTVGNTDADQIVSAVEKGSGGSVRVFNFGIGNDVNTHLLDKIAAATRAFSQYVLPEEDIEVKVSNFYTKIKDPVLANPKLDISGDIRLSKMYPGSLPDLFRGEQLVLAGRYSGSGDAKVTVEGSVNGQTRKVTYTIKFPGESTEHQFIPRLWATRRVGHLLEEIRLRGDNKELRDEVTDLARRYGIVTPYTAYLIVEDEEARRIPMPLRSLSSLQGDPQAREGVAQNFSRLLAEDTGAGAVAGAREQNEFKMAEKPAEALTAARREASRGYASAPAADRGVAARVERYTEQSRHVNGRTFYQNGDTWIDSEAQKLKDAGRVRMKFGSDEYFDLLAKNADVGAWLSVARSVQFALDGKIYEITE